MSTPTHKKLFHIEGCGRKVKLDPMMSRKARGFHVYRCRSTECGYTEIVRCQRELFGNPYLPEREDRCGMCEESQRGDDTLFAAERPDAARAEAEAQA